MAHITKYKQGQCHHLINHDNRSNTNDKENIDHSRSYLNYNLCSIKNENEYLSELIKRSKDNGGRFTDKTNVLISYVITLPENFPNNEALEKEFFKGAYNMICEDIGEENIISAWVHYDENLKNTNKPNKPHIHIKAAPLKEKIKTYKNGTTKTILQFDAKNTITLNYLQQFHKRLEKNIEEWLGFKADVITGITKAQGGNKTISELKTISERENYINKNPSLILAEQKTILNDYWEEYKKFSNSYWSYYKTTKERIKNEIWEIKKTKGQITKQLENDLDFISNLSKGLLFALFKLFSAIIIHYRKRILENDLKTIQGKLEALDKERRSISNYQNNTKEKLKEKDLDKIENALNSWENAILKANEKIKENILNRAKNENKGNLRAFREEYEQR